MKWDLGSENGHVIKFTHSTAQDDHIKKCPTNTSWTPAGQGTSLRAVALESDFLNRNFKIIGAADFEALPVSHILWGDSSAHDWEYRSVCESQMWFFTKIWLAKKLSSSSQVDLVVPLKNTKGCKNHIFWLSRRTKIL